MNNPLVIVDADAIVAQAFPSDSNHGLAVSISQKLARLNAQVIYPVTAILEATTVLQKRLSSSATAYGTAVTFTDPNVGVTEVSQETLVSAMKYFSPVGSKRNTLFDCVVIALAHEKQAGVIFSFDKFYKKNGFKLAGELL